MKQLTIDERLTMCMENLINILKYQENNLSFDFILNRLNLFSISNKYALKTNKMTL
jgi:hypothetical protein